MKNYMLFHVHVYINDDTSEEDVDNIEDSVRNSLACALDNARQSIAPDFDMSFERYS